MNDRGAERWVKLMNATLDATGGHMTDDPRVRIAINTFLMHFLGKYAQEFNFGDIGAFGETNAAVAWGDSARHNTSACTRRWCCCGRGLL